MCKKGLWCFHIVFAIHVVFSNYPCYSCCFVTLSLLLTLFFQSFIVALFELLLLFLSWCFLCCSSHVAHCCSSHCHSFHVALFALPLFSCFSSCNTAPFMLLFFSCYSLLLFTLPLFSHCCSFHDVLFTLLLLLCCCFSCTVALFTLLLL